MTRARRPRDVGLRIGGGRNLRLCNHRAAERSAVNIQRAGFSTKARTWLLLAGLTALFIGVGAAIGGAFLWFFVVFSILMNVAAYWASDKFAIKAARAKPVTEAEAPDLHRLIEELAQ